VSSFIKSTPFKTTFDGDEVTCRFKSIEQNDSLRIVALRKDDGSVMHQELAPLYVEILPKYTEEFKGLRSSDGSVIELADVLKYTYFWNLVIELGNALAKTGRVPDPKALASQQDVTLAA
jgi:hypothetical protein